ncbi:SPW repeat protein [Bythopirellula goksoyri]|uniref:SPW repeat protein n=2 Tax=Bythopirellula goksoeyrii TaxID=1400387 RepID=A0A5B9QIQ5_9BACT|nr:SPW repeat protein [Bythopirellula goksoeyrii]
MWARVVECMLGCWLLMSPFIFGHASDTFVLWSNDLLIGGLVIVLALASYWSPTAWAHWMLIFVGIWLIGFGRLGSTPPLPGAQQNQIILGLLLTMFAIIPNHASHPPRGWQTSD